MESSCCGADIHWSGPLGPSVEPQLPLSAFKFRQAVCAVNVVPEKHQGNVVYQEKR